MKIKEDERFIDNIVNTLRKAAIEIEELQVQTALGKAEARDKYKEVKKKCTTALHETKAKIKTGKENIGDIETKFDELGVQLELGKADGIDSFRKEKRKLLSKLHEIEVKIKTNKQLSRLYAFVLLEIEKFKLNLSILEQKFEQSKQATKTPFDKSKRQFDQFIETIKDKYEKKEDTKWEHFQGEISEAFRHFKKAFTQQS